MDKLANSLQVWVYSHYLAGQDYCKRTPSVWVKASALMIRLIFPPFVVICLFIKHGFDRKKISKKIYIINFEKIHEWISEEERCCLINIEAFMMSVTWLFLHGKELVSGKHEILLSFAFRNFYFVYMCLILHVSMSIEFFYIL